MAVAYPSSRTETSSLSYSSAFASSTVASFSPRASPLMSTKSSAAANIRLHDRRSSLPPTPPSPPSSVRLSVERRPPSPGLTKRNNENNKNAAVVPSATREEKKKPAPACMCSPTAHAGSFRCGYHKRLAEQKEQQRLQQQEQQRQQAALLRSRKLNLRRSALRNSLVKIGCVEADLLVKRALTNTVRSASQQVRRREAYQPRPSRLSVMSKAQ